MPIDVLMPQLSPTMKEGRLANWLKAEGDAVSAGDIIAEVETDKATMEVEATDDGVIHQIIGEVGTDIQVGVPIAVLKADGEEVPADYTPKMPEPEAPAEETKTEGGASAPAAAPVQATVAPAGMMAAPALPKMNVAAAAAPATAGKKTPTGERVKASPLARRLAEQKGVDLRMVEATGPRGRVVAKDVAKARPGVGAGGNAPISRQQDTLTKLTPMRKAIASRLTAAKQYIPHFYLSMDVTLDTLLETRKQLNTLAAQQAGDGAPAYKLTVNDFVLKACANGLADFPEANAAWAEDSVVNFGNVDISVAVAIEGGLITPIVFNADQKSLMTISQEVKALAKQAKSGTLKPEQFEGGSFSLSNLGMFGVSNFNAIVNPPQAAILAVGAGEQRVIVNKAGDFSTATVMTLTLSVDHRVIDGALGAELLGAIKFYLENPATLLV